MRRTSSPPRGRPPPPPSRLATRYPNSDSDDENNTNDISSAAFDIGSGALASDQKLKVSKQKAKLESKLSEKERTVNAPSPAPALELHANENLSLHDVISSFYRKDNGFEGLADTSVRVEYSTPFPPSLRRDRSISRWNHISQTNLDFDDFMRHSNEMPGLPEDQIQSLSNFLQKVRKDLDRVIRSQRGAMGNFMKPDYITRKIQTDEGPDRTYVFCCLSYHQLKPYSPLADTINTRLHPIRTLLQSKYPSTTKQRDLQQAVCSLDGTPAEHCFHISTLWCLIINNKFMVTCTNGMSSQQIAGERLNLVSSVPAAPLSASSMPKSIQVLLGRRIYVFPLPQCDTWFKFIQNFSKYTLVLHEQYTIKWKGVNITAELWPLVISQTEKENVRLNFSPRKTEIVHRMRERDIDQEIDDAFRASTPGDDRLSVISEVDSVRDPRSRKSPNAKSGPVSPQVTRSTSPTPGSIDFRDFHILAWIAIRLGKLSPKEEEPETTASDAANPPVKIDKAIPKSSRELVIAYLNSIHSWLENQKDSKARALYRKATQKSMEDVERAMQGMHRACLNNPTTDASKTDLIESVKSIFSLFLPLNQRGAMCLKLWGALHSIITAVVSEDAYYQVHATVQTLTSVATVANIIKAQLSGGNAPSPEKFAMPPDALRVWHQLILCLLFWSPINMGISERHANKCLTLFGKAHQDLMTNPKAKKLEDLEAVLPSSLLAIIVSNVVSDFTGDQPDLVQSYWESFDQLELKIARDPLNRRHQAKISAFISEAKIIRDSLESQLSVMYNIETDLQGDGIYGEELSVIQPPDLAVELLRETLDRLNGKQYSVEELLESSQDLLEKHADAIRHNKDKQEGAIYVFTIVTVVFLPISTVASVLGMNTNDVRNMEKTQWVFWAAAVPLTAIIIVVSLFAAGVLVWPKEWRRHGSGKRLARKTQ